MKRYLVIDQNALRKPLLSKIITSEPDTQFVLPDLSFLEMTKSAQWERTLQESLKQLAEIPNRVHVAYSVNRALADELRTLRPANNHMLHIDATRCVREILAWVHTGAETDAVNMIRSDREDHISGLAADHLNHVENKYQYGDLIGETKQFIPDEVQKLMRGGKLDWEDQLIDIHQIAVGLFPQILEERGIDGEKAQCFLKTRPMVFRYLLVKVWYCVHWISKGGFETLRRVKASNEILDHQYVLTGSVFNGILSEEIRVNEVYNDLSILLDKKV